MIRRMASKRASNISFCLSRASLPFFPPIFRFGRLAHAGEDYFWCAMSASEGPATGRVTVTLRRPAYATVGASATYTTDFQEEPPSSAAASYYLVVPRHTCSNVCRAQY